MEVVKDFENKLLDRKEILVKLSSEGVTPNKVDVKAQLAKKFKAKEELIVINKISSTFGSRDVVVDASIYNKEEVLKRLTPGHILKRNTVEVAAAAEGEE